MTKLSECPSARHRKNGGTLKAAHEHFLRFGPPKSQAEFIPYHYPKLSYRRSLSLWFREPGGQAVRVQGCEPYQFRQMIEGCLAVSQEEIEDIREIRALLAGSLDELTRWYILETLLSAHVKVPVVDKQEVQS